MFKEITPINLSTGKTDISFTYPVPGQCPQCKKGIDNVPLDSYYIKKNKHAIVFIFYFCPSCETCFIGQYTCYNPEWAYRNDLKQDRLIPHGIFHKSFSKEITAMSPSFVSIYKQAYEAEKTGLSQICGIGYRKALEFLIKDFAIFVNPDETENIKTSMLSACIEKYIDSQRIKVLAKASAWIGNDETHYVRKHEDYSLEDLKLFIDSTVAFIDSELTFLQAQNLIQSRQQQK